ncbi:MAG TPA: hypothetical protein VNH11_23955 [Pirellulales bacterium]|nr:hypothetical protein [Pirellulales bacterium]
MATEAGSRMAQGAGDYWHQGRQALRAFDDRVEATVRERPMTAVFAALGAGIVIGILLPRLVSASFLAPQDEA